MALQDRILFEDNHLIAVNKLPGELVQGDKTGDTPLSDSIKYYLKRKYNKPGNVYLGVLHRIDRPTSGVVIFARTSKAASRMSQSFKEKKIDKSYLAIVPKSPEIEIPEMIRNFLKKNEKQNKSYVSETPKEGYKEGITHVETLDKSDRYQLLKLKIMTGRHHQIRAQLSNLGLPIKGDLKYGSKRSNQDGSIDLHANEIGFVHPVKKEYLRIFAPHPKGIWDIFTVKY